MAMNGVVDDQYKVPLIAKLLHQLPHYNITFHRTNNTFRPTDEVYLESLGILGSAPAALLILSLFGLLLYLLTRCCDRKPRTQHSITSLKVTLSVVTVLCCAAIGLGLYGNDDLHNGLLEVLQSGRKVDNIISSVRNQTQTLESTLANKIRPQLVELADIFDQPASNQTALSQLILSLNIVQGNVTTAKNAAADIRRPLMQVTITSFLSRGDQYELIRWPGTVAVLALLLVLCAVLLVGVARHSRCALILFSVCGLLAVTGSWLMSGLYLSSSVAVGDLCMDPAGYLVSQAPNDLPTEVLLYYTQCESVRSNPFTLRLRESQNAINNARSAMNIVSRISLVLYKSAGLQPKLGAVTADLNNSERLLTTLTALVDCRDLHRSYLAATRGLCESGLLGLLLMLIASFTAAILLTIMVWVDSHTWIYIRKRIDYSQVDEASYASNHGQQPGAPIHPQQQPNHNNSHVAARTLPRNMHNGPPVISGSHTLQHPGRNKQEMIMAAQYQQQQQQQQQQQHNPNIRQLGSHTMTMGRMPPSHMSPQHHGANKHVCTDARQYAMQQQQQQQGNAQQPAYHHQQMSQYGQTQPTYQTQPQYVISQGQPPQMQDRPRQNAPNDPMAHNIYNQQMMAALPQNVLYHQQQIQNHYSLQPQPQPMHHRSPQTNQQGMPPPGQMHPQQQNIYSHNNAAVIMSGAATLRRPPQNQAREAMEQNPNTNLPDNIMMDRDKQQMFKYSTLRQGGKFDPRNFGPRPSIPNGAQNPAAQKPSILNCPLPEIPKEHAASNGNDPNKITSPRNLNTNGGAPPLNQPTMTRTLQRPFKNLPPTGKAIPPPKIADSLYQSKAALTKPPIAPSTAHPTNGTTTTTTTLSNSHQPAVQPPSSPPLPPPPEPTQNLDYAVTEL
ncbi:protein tweety isoform X2 [Sitodiplosis mosellana]|uniref:protein tweety isoform X2 n=1 Tax=Sitodiplosis mosellana TaxID=263140 RepID=UPI002443CBCE|nr:protein tweety isoform X2 [Sitodiplosis mosellana]